MKIAIGGCVASQEGENIIKRAPAVDIVFGPQTLHKLPELYENKNKTNINQVDISFPKLEKFNHIPVNGTLNFQRLFQLLRAAINIVLFVLFQKQEVMRYQEQLKIF